MSWFDATGFANLAKSALKEAQKTIDKALDIKEEEEEDQKLRGHCSNDVSDFFASWGLKSDEGTIMHDKNKESKQETSSSIWGSFTGSFFESPKYKEGGYDHKRISESKSMQNTSIGSQQETKKLTSSKSFSVDYTNKQQNLSKNLKCVDENSAEKETPTPMFKNPNLLNMNTIKDSTSNMDEKIKEGTTGKDPEISGSARCLLEESDIAVDNKITSLESEQKNICQQELLIHDDDINGTSLVSTENDKKSLESVEILGSRSNTDCTTTPESVSNSISNSASPSGTDAKLNSESVEILPDSLVTSPSSVEILGDWKSDSSPYLSPIDPLRTETCSALDREDSVTPCWDTSHIEQFSTKNESYRHPSSSDVSPYESPVEEVNTPRNDFGTSSMKNTLSVDACSRELGSHSISKFSTFSVEQNLKICPLENVERTIYPDEPDETSLAEDSYASASDSTVATVFETVQQKTDQSKIKTDTPASVSFSGKMNDSCLDQTVKEKSSLYLPIEVITIQPFRKSTEYIDSAGTKTETERKNIDPLSNNTIEPTESESESKPELESEPDPEGELEPELEPKSESESELTQMPIPVPMPASSERYSTVEQATLPHLFKSDTMDIVDHHLISTDSSCEGTLIESNSEDNPSTTHKSEVKLMEPPLTASSYVKTMLADAMIEKVSEIVDLEGQGTDIPRENSPISSESRSDLVKIGSDQTSGHTSGDELETTTSSDIEIISSPNGDSSSTQSRQSVMRSQSAKGSDLLTKTLKSRGHSRELSEISVGSDEANLEIETLLKRIQEMTEILEARESKLIDVSRMNMELQEQNSNFKKQLDNFERYAEQSQNLNQIADDYTQRLSALERKFQQAIRERDSLRKNLEQLKMEASTRLSSQEMYTLSAEKDEIIKELREEGDKLSKQQLQHSNIIKKLRIKEKENDALIKSQKILIDEQTLELERLKKSLHAKEEVERTQIEAVHTLTAKTRKQEKEILALQEKLDTALHKMGAYKKSLDMAKMDLTETKKLLQATEAELKDASNNAGESCQLLAQVEELKIKLRESTEMHAKKEEFYKHENSELLKRLEAAEARSEELSESVSTATKPLVRQLEQLHANLSHKCNSFMKQEKALSEKNLELQTKVEHLTEANRYLKEETVNFNSKLSQLESKLAAKQIEISRLEESCDGLMIEKEKLAEETARYRRTIETLEQSHSSQIMELNREIVALESRLAVEKTVTDAEQRKNHTISEQRRNIDHNEPRNSPVAEATNQVSSNPMDIIWPLYDSGAVDENTERYALMYDSFRAGSSSTSVFENLQAQLKQKDGEIQQLQWELSRRNVERDALNTELSTLTLKIEELNNKVSHVTILNENLQDIQTRYDALLQMCGEKMEENEELRLDLQDVKDVYKTQIDQLMKENT